MFRRGSFDERAMISALLLRIPSSPRVDSPANSRAFPSLRFCAPTRGSPPSKMANVASAKNDTGRTTVLGENIEDVWGSLRARTDSQRSRNNAGTLWGRFDYRSIFTAINRNSKSVGLVEK